MKSLFPISAVLLAALALPARAADVPAAAEPAAPPSAAAPLAAGDKAQYQLTVYGWATALNGEVGVRGLPATSVDIPAGTTLSKLDGALMASLMAEKGDWTGLIDAIYAKLGDDAAIGPRKAVTASLDLRQLILSGLIGYRLPLPLPPSVRLSATAGVRYQHFDASFGVSGPAGLLQPGASGTIGFADPTVGLMMNYAISDKWFLNVIGDVGGFGLSSKLTAQGFAAVGYNWTPEISTALGYRAIYTDHTDNGFVYNVTQHGAFASVAYHF